MSNPMTRRAWIFGREMDCPPATTATADGLVAQGRMAAERLASVPLATILDVLEGAGRAWERGGRAATEAEELLCSILPFSPETVRDCLDLVPGLLSRTALEERLALELGEPACLDGWVEPRPVAGGRRLDGLLRACPLGLVVNVSAGNVFLGALDAIVSLLLTKNAAVVKLSSADPWFPILVARTLAAADPDGLVAGALALVPWSGGDASMEGPLKTGADAVVVWGGEEAVAAWRRGLGTGTRVVEHGPRLGLAVVLREALADGGRAAARALARDVARWDQAACSSPQNAWVEADRAAVEDFAVLVARELEILAGVVPPGRLDVAEQVELTKTREMAAFAEAVGEGRLFMPPGRDSRWTVTVTTRAEPEPSPLSRCILLKPLASIDELPAMLRPHRAHLQTVGVAGPAERKGSVAEALCRVGVTRVTELGAMGEGVAGGPHDGRFPLHELIRWTCREHCAALSVPERLEALLTYVRDRSPFFRSRLAGLDLTQGRDLARVPFTTTAELVANVPPRGTALLTGELLGAHVFSSGGSTGAPKYVHYTAEEFDDVSRVLARCFRAAGVRPGDRAGNLFVAGNLWTSFLAVHQALEHVGCTTLPIGGACDMRQTLRWLVDFKATVLLGIPSILMEVARLVKAENAASALSLRLLLYAGEHLTEATARLFSEVFGGAVVRSAGYASVDAGTVGYQCGHARGTWHHLLSDYQYLEFLDPETGAPVAPGEPGEMVATNLSRRLMPVIRMKTGDLGRLGVEPCPCGSSDPLFELMGRADDRVFVGSARFLVGDLARCAGSSPGLTSQVQVVLDSPEGADRLTIRVEALDELDPGRRRAMADVFLERFLEAEEDVRAAVTNAWLARPTVEVLAPGGLPRVERTGKVRRVVDERRRPA